MNEEMWKQNMIDKYRIKDGISVDEIIDLYLNRCKEAKRIFDGEVKLYKPFEVKLCDILNNSFGKYFDGKVDISNIHEIEKVEELNPGVQTASFHQSHFDEKNSFLMVDLENVWKHDDYNKNIYENEYFFPNIYINKDFDVFIPENVLANIGSDYSSKFCNALSIIDSDILKKVRYEILNNKDELNTLKKISDKYNNSNYNDKISKRRSELLESINGSSVKLDNDVTLRFSLNSLSNFDESKFERENIKIEFYDKNKKLIFYSNNGLCEEDNNIFVSNEGIIKKDNSNYKHGEIEKMRDDILNYVSDDSCVWSLKAPMDTKEQINANKKVALEIEKEKKMDLAIDKALKNKEEVDERLKELKKDNDYYLEQYKNTLNQMEELTGKASRNRIPGMSEDMLFEKDDKGILRVRDKYKDKLNLFDLSLIKWNDVLVRGLDFTGTNVKINPEDVYDKDLSNIVFVSEKEDGSDFIFSEFSQFSSVNLSGAVIKCKNNYLNLEGALMDDNTVIEATNIVKEKGNEEKINGLNDFEKEILENYRNKYKTKKDARTKQDALDSLATDIFNGLLTEDDIYSFIRRKELENNTDKIRHL